MNLISAPKNVNAHCWCNLCASPSPARDAQSSDSQFLIPMTGEHSRFCHRILHRQYPICIRPTGPTFQVILRSTCPVPERRAPTDLISNHAFRLGEPQSPFCYQWQSFSSQPISVPHRDIAHFLRCGPSLPTPWRETTMNRRSLSGAWATNPEPSV